MKRNLSIVKSIFCAFTSCCVGFLFLLPVKAESDILYPDPYSYTAYNYFFNNGYNTLRLTSTDNITYNVRLDNIGSNNGSITGTDGLSGSSHETGTVGSNGSATLGSKYMTCTTNNAVSGTQTYSCYFSSSSYGVNNSQSINIQMNENTYEDFGNVDLSVNETINQSINTDITGSITTSESSKHYTNLPWIYGTYTKTSGYDAKKRVYVNNTNYNDIFLIFFTKERIRNNDYTGVTFYTGSGNPTFTYRYSDQVFGGLYLNSLRIQTSAGAGNISIQFDNLVNQEIIPMYFGVESQIPDDIAILIGRRLPLSYILNNGDENTNSSISSANTATNQVSNKINQFDNIENNSVNDMNSKISNLNITSDILSNSKFLSSARWVKTQFDNITVGTPIGSVLAFSLILGVALIFVGKYR